MPEERGQLWHRREPGGTGIPGREPAGARLVGRPTVPVRVYLRRTAWDTIDEWANAFSPPREVGGLLLGQARRNAREAVILIEGVLPALHAVAGQGPFRFTHDDWVGFRAAWERLGATHAVVGWFHTHPGSGTSPSGYDRIVAQRFFPEWWQVTYIIDPVNLRQAVFHWQDGELAPLAGFWVYESDEPPVVDPLAPSAAAVAAAAAGGSRLPAAAGRRRRSRHGAWIAALLILAALAWVPGLPGSLPWLRATMLHQTTEAGRLAAELNALQDRHALLQQLLAEAQQAARPAGASGRGTSPSPAPAATPGSTATTAVPGGVAGQNRREGTAGVAGPTSAETGAAARPPVPAGASQPGAGGAPASTAGVGAGAAAPPASPATAAPATGAPSAAAPSAATVPSAVWPATAASTSAPAPGPPEAQQPAAPWASPAEAGLTLDSDVVEPRYVVREGDTLWSISGRLLGDPRAYSRLAAANRIANPDLILPGWELRVPSSEEPQGE
ncbi:MAG TPA: LysM peptidoglycan-binding domain-containing protein [Limnochordales bacterium]